MVFASLNMCKTAIIMMLVQIGFVAKLSLNFNVEMSVDCQGP